MKYQNTNMLRITSIFLTILFLGLMSASFVHAETYNLAAKWGSNGSNPGQFYYPMGGIAVDSSNNVYVDDTFNNRIQKFSSNGTFITQWGSFGTGNGQFYRPIGIAVDSSDNVYVADFYNNNIQKFDSKGDYLSQFNPHIKFIEPESIAVDYLGNIIVQNYTYEIDKYSNNGTKITTFGFPGWCSVYDDVMVNVNDIAVDHLNNIYTSNYGTGSILKFDNNGNYISQFWSAGNSTGQFPGFNMSGQFASAESIAVDSSGNIYVAGYDNRTTKMDSRGNILAQWNSYDSGKENLEYPSATTLHFIAVDSLGDVFILNTYDSCIEKYVTNNLTTPVANFTSNVTNGSAPLTVQFTDTSKGSPTNWTWEFGDGNTSTVQNPVYKYYTNGTYTITLTASNDYGSNSTTSKINVFEPLVANFTTNITANGVNMGRAPLTVQFNDTSTGNPTSWSWEFGDGNTSEGVQNPIYTYQQPGNYTVNLSVSNAYGSNATNQTILVMYQPYPNGYSFKNWGSIDLTPEDFYNTFGLNVPNNPFSKEWCYYELFFKHGTNGGNCFGISSTSLLLYNNGINNAYSYDIISKDDWIKFNNFYHDKSRIPIALGDWVTTYSELQDTEACEKDMSAYKSIKTICNVLNNHLSSGKFDMVLGIANINPFSSNGHALVPYNIEESPDGQSAKIYVYDSNHPYKSIAPADSVRYVQVNPNADVVKGNVSNYETVTNINEMWLFSLKAITEPPKLPSWVYIEHYGLTPNHVAHLLFTDLIGNRLLGFIKGGVYRDEIPGTSPIVSLRDNENNNSSIEAYYVPDPSIKMELCGNGTGDSETSMITPNGLITADVPVTPTSVDQFKVINNGTGIEFIPESGSAPSIGLMLDVETPDHAQVVNANISQVEVGGSVNLSNDNGTVTIQNIGLPRTCNLSLKQYTSSQNSTVNLTNILVEANSTVSVVPSNWNDLSNSTAIVTDVDSNGTVIYSNTIYFKNPPIMPLANFTSNVTQGYAPLDVQFNDSSFNATHLEWNFGDNTGNTSVANPEHVFMNAGQFNVVLTANNTNGTSSKSMSINVTAKPVLPVAGFTEDVKTGVAPLSVNFTDKSQYATTVNWDFNGDGVNEKSGSTGNQTYTYTTPGTYVVNQTVINANGTANATDTITVTKPIIIIPVKANFTFSANYLAVQFTDTSTGAPNNWTWDYGDNNGSNAPSPSHTYANAGTYPVKLSVKNAAGSTDSITKSVTVTAAPLPLNANFTENTTSGVAPLTVQFTDQSTGNIASRSWDFNDTFKSPDLNPLHTFTNAGSFNVILTVTDTLGATAKKNVTITVSAPNPPASALKINGFKADITSGYEPLTVHFTSDVSGNPTTWTWKFDRLGTQSFKVGTATHTFMDDGVYDVTLTVKDALGHTDTMTKKAYITVLKVPAPKANFVGNVTSGKAPLTVQFNDTSINNPTNWLWSFGDGQISLKQNPVHKYERAGTYTVILTDGNYGGIDTKIVKNDITVSSNKNGR